MRTLLQAIANEYAGGAGVSFPRCNLPTHVEAGMNRRRRFESLAAPFVSGAV